MIDLRSCTKCNISKPLTEFYSDKNRRDGLTLRCKECLKAKSRQARIDNPEKIREQQRNSNRKYYATGRVQELRLANLDEQRRKDRERQRRWSAENRDRYQDRMRRWKNAHRETVREQGREYMRKVRLENPEPLRERTKIWRRKNPAVVLMHNERRRARKLNATGIHTHDQWKCLVAWFGNACLCCGQDEEIVKDHVVPLARGGSDGIENLQPLCRMCNARKHAKTIDHRNPALLSMFLGEMAL